jgi:acyl-CoA hydrolase
MRFMDAIAEHDSKYSKAQMLEIIFPGNTNSLGTAFGGHMLSLMDKAAAFAAGRYSLTAVVTASIDRVDFRVPIRVGDVVELVGTVVGVGHTSMSVRVDVFKEDRATRAQTLATQGFFVMVSIGPDGKTATVNRPEPRAESQVETQAESRGLA